MSTTDNDGLALIYASDCHKHDVVGAVERCQGEKGSGRDLRGVDLNNDNLSGRDLACADLRQANLSYTTMWSADLTRANLEGANLYNADLARADLTGAMLRDANLDSASLGETILEDADLRGAVLGAAQVHFNSVPGSGVISSRSACRGDGARDTVRVHGA
ncbi:MAG: pentapeptide repeat-containing protein [Actinomycetota bacterium]|nr:pentapeptide repeat-containing protein [Actinomycetota bacterium]